MSLQANPRFAALPDGRRLAYRSAGPRDGMLVIYLHGAIGSPQGGCRELDAILDELRIHYVMVSRPGFDCSDPLPGRTLLGFAADVAQLADGLGQERFAVVGVSAGGPYALACAHELPDRVAAAAVVSSMSPCGGLGRAGGLPRPLRLALAALRRWPRACAAAGDLLLRAARRHPRLVARAMRAGAPVADRNLLSQPQARDLAVGRFFAAAGRGIGWMIDDYRLCAGAWGFEPGDVRGEVHLWHGAQDALVPVETALRLAAALPRVRAAVDPEDGHFFYCRRRPEILAELAQAIGEPLPARPARPARPALRQRVAA